MSEAKNSTKTGIMVSGPALTNNEKQVDSLTCKLCNNIFYEPTDLKCCGMTFCYKCLQSLVNQSKPCPNCKKSFHKNDFISNPIISKILQQLKPSLILRRKIAEHHAHPHLQTKKSILDLKNEIVNTIVEDEIIPFFVRYSSPYSPTEKARLCNPNVPEPENPKKKEFSFVRGYRCDCRMPISSLRNLMATKFDIDENFAEIAFYCKNEKLEDHCSLRTIAYRRNEPYSKRMYLDMKILPKMSRKKKVKVAKKIADGPPVLEDERMPSLSAEEPELESSKSPEPELSELDEACLVDARLMYARNVAVATIHKFNEAKMRGKKPPQPQVTIYRGLAQIPKMSEVVMSQFFDAFRGHFYEKWARALIRPLPIWLQPMEDEPGTSTRSRFDHLLLPETKTPISPAKNNTMQQKSHAATYNQAVTFNQAATNQALEYYVLRAYKYKIPAERFLEEYYSCANRPPPGTVLTNEQKMAYAYRERFDSTGVIIPRVEAPVQAQLYKQMLDKKELMAKAQLEQEEQLKQQQNEQQRVQKYLQQQLLHEQQKQQWKVQQQNQGGSGSEIAKKPKQARKRKSVTPKEGEPVVKKLVGDGVAENPKRSQVTAYVSSRPIIMSAQQCAISEVERSTKRESSSPPPLLIAEEADHQREETIEPSVTSSVSPSRSQENEGLKSHGQSPIGEVSSTSEEKHERKEELNGSERKIEEKCENENANQPTPEKAPPTPPRQVDSLQDVDLLTLSRQSSKTLGKTLAESMRKGAIHRSANIISQMTLIPISPPSEKVVTSSTTEKTA